MAGSFSDQFFAPDAPPPTCAEKPRDATLSQRIEKVADFANRNGPDFVQLIENKQLHNPDFQFLFGGEGHDYYRWYLYQLVMGQSIAASETAPASEVESEFGALLTKLDDSKDSVRACQHSFLRDLSHAAEMAQMMYRHVQQQADIHRQLDVIYLIHDILLKSQSHCSDREARLIETTLQTVLGGMFATIYLQSNRADDVQRRLSKFLSSWSEHDVFSRRAIDSFEQAMLSGYAGIQPRGSSEGQGSYPTDASDRMLKSEEISRRKHRRSDNWDHKGSSLPPHMTNTAKTSQTSWGVLASENSARSEGRASESRPGSSSRARTRAAFDPPPERLAQTGVVDAFSFPPGLLTILVSDKNKLSFSYCPIQSTDIQKSNYPSVVDPNDPYLKSRLEKFYAELDEYRPGMVREHVESRKRKEEDEGEAESASDARRRRVLRTAMALSEADRLTSTLPDGSYAGEGSESRHAGLGTQAASRLTEEEKAFNQYRKLRSDVYHHVIPKGTPPSAPK